MNRSNRIKVVISFVLLVSVIAVFAMSQFVVQAQTESPATAQRSITVTGMGGTSGAPDIANLQLGIDSADVDPAVAYENANNQIETMSAALIEMGISARDIQTSNFNLYWSDKYNPATGMPTGEREYHVQHTLNVIIRDIAQVGAVIGTALDTGSNSIYGLTFGIDDPTSLVNEARSIALDDAQLRAEEIAQNIGVQLGEIITVTEGATYPQMVYSMAPGGRGGGGGNSEAPISEGSLAVDVQVTVTYAIGE